MKRLPLLLLPLALSPLVGIARADDDDPFKFRPENTGGTSVLTSALDDAVSLVAAQPALLNEDHEKLYQAYKAALAKTDTAFAAREKALAASIAAALEKAKAGLDPAGVKSATEAIAATKGGKASMLGPRKGDPAALAAVKQTQLARYQRLRAAHGLAHADRIRDYLASLEKFQRALAAGSKLTDSVFIAKEARGLRKLLASGGTGGAPLAAFQFKSLPLEGARTPVPPFHSGLPILTAIGGDFTESSSVLALRPPSTKAGSDGSWDLRGGMVPQVATGAVTLMEAPLIDFPGAEITTREWRGGTVGAPVKLIPAAEGFCMIGGLRGPFEKGTEARLVLNPTDKCWYLSGQGGTGETAVSILIVRFPNAAERPTLTLKSFTWSNLGPHLRLSDSASSFCVFTRLVGPLEDRATALALTIGPDGYWYLQGRATASVTTAEATAFTFTPAS